MKILRLQADTSPISCTLALSPSSLVTLTTVKSDILYFWRSEISIVLFNFQQKCNLLKIEINTVKIQTKQQQQKNHTHTHRFK